MILLRADANEIIGTGHVMRCLSTAKAMSDLGEEVAFVIADMRSAKLIEEQGYQTICLDSDWTDMDNERMEDLVSRTNPKLLIVDSYYVTEKYLSNLSGVTKTAYFDDMNACCWDVDYLINYNIFSEVFDYSAYEDTKTKLLLGPKYAPLRAEFQGLPEHEIIGEISDVLVSAGGVDPEGITLRIINYMCSKWVGIHFHFIVGALNPRIDEIKAAAKSNVILHINEHNVSQLMRDCDVAIAAAGTTLYELCATGIPTIAYSLADNQIVATGEFERQGIMMNAGDCRNNEGFIDDLERALRSMITDIDLRRRYSRKMQSLVDGHGAERLADELIGA